MGSARRPVPTGAAAKGGCLSQACLWLSHQGQGKPCSSITGGTCPDMHAEGPRLMDLPGEMEARAGASLVLTLQIYHRWCGTPAGLEQGPTLP